MPRLSSRHLALLDDFSERIKRAVERSSQPVYEPSGLQEDIIVPFGSGEYSIVLAICANKVGKTCTAANILKNIFWKYDQKWFDYPLFRDWPYPKRGRVTCTTKNATPEGPIHAEITRWWPADRFSESKNGKHYYSEYHTDTGFSFDVMTYEQAATELEGPLCGWTWSDEPVPAKWVGGILSRFSLGGIWLITATPIECGVFLDTLDDLKEKGKTICTVSANIYQNSIISGKPNHLGTRRGLMTDDQIKEYVAGIPLDEQDARIFGKKSNKSGKIYPMFTPAVHVKNFDLTSDYAKKWNCFCVMDPHPKYYPFLSWWGITPDEKYVCYQEWPTFNTLGAYYDEVRDSRIFSYTPDQMAEIIQILDGTSLGLTIMGRCMDPRFAATNTGEYAGTKTDSLQAMYAEHGIFFDTPPFEEIAIQRERIRQLLYYNDKLPINAFNEPQMYFMAHCTNMIRSFDRHHWEEGKQKEAELFKDPCDTARYFLSYLGKRKWIDPRQAAKRVPVIDVMAKTAEEFMRG